MGFRQRRQRLRLRKLGRLNNHHRLGGSLFSLELLGRFFHSNRVSGEVHVSLHLVLILELINGVQQLPGSMRPKIQQRHTHGRPR